jgi:hypothetical protein
MAASNSGLVLIEKESLTVINKKDLILYSHYKVKKPRYWELLKD